MITEHQVPAIVVHDDGDPGTIEVFARRVGDFNGGYVCCTLAANLSFHFDGDAPGERWTLHAPSLLAEIAAIRKEKANESP